MKCDVSSWADQVAVFKAAAASSPSGRIDVVIPNAGIGGQLESVFSTKGKWRTLGFFIPVQSADEINNRVVEDTDPEEPKLKIMNINLTGVLYTVKLALHYFRRQNASNKGGDLDQVLILQGSLAGFLAIPGAVEYSTSKWGVRGIFRTLRETEFQHNIRVCYIAPSFVYTNILGDGLVQLLNNSKIEWATVEDAAEAVMRIVTDPNVQGICSQVAYLCES